MYIYTATQVLDLIRSSLLVAASQLAAGSRLAGHSAAIPKVVAAQVGGAGGGGESSWSSGPRGRAQPLMDGLHSGDGPVVEWMWADSGTPITRKLAKKNPLRWTE
jgi:hypothetical protein